MDGVYPHQSVSQALLHVGVANLISSTTGSNIPGGYLPGKDKLTDTPLSVWKARREWEKKVEQGIYPDLHFGFKLNEDLSHYLNENDCSVGEALRNVKNRYLPEDLDWQLWWTPPLRYDHDGNLVGSSSGGPTGLGPHKDTKYTTYFEFTLYGDPAFNPYEPSNNG
jgi:hypothetical protein